MDFSELTNLSVAAITLGILFFITRYFVDAMKSKDSHIAKLTADFNKTINNHIDHETKQRKKETEVLERLTQAVEALTAISKRKK